MPERPQNKHLQPGQHLDALGVTPLEPGQVTDVSRVRADAAALVWWKSLSAAERGAIVEQAYASRND